MKTSSRVAGVAAFLVLAACGKQPTGGVAASQAPQNSTNPPTLTNKPVVLVPPVALPTLVTPTVYALSETRTADNGGFSLSYSVTAECYVTDSKTFCKDDGVHSVTWPGLTGTFSFFDVGNIGSGCQPGANGNLGTDCMVGYTEITGSLETNIGALALRVLNEGTAQ